ncbi:MAG: hypothetical protein ACOYBR_03000 [Fluviibacter sp.]
MGHADAQRRKIELGLIRPLDEYDVRKVKALQWMVRWGFSTSKILNELFLSKNDLARMKKENLVDDFPTCFKPHKDSKPQPLTIWYPSKRGRIAGKVLDEYTGKPYPSIPLASHDLLCQAFVCDRLERNYGGFKGCPQFGVRPARMIQKMGMPGIDLEQFLPDAIYGVQGRLSVIEVERNPILIKRGEGALLEQFKFLEKLNHLVDTLSLPLTLLYITQAQADKSWELCSAAAAYGYPSFSKTVGGDYWPEKEIVGNDWIQVKKPILFPLEDVRFESLERLDLSKWLP